MNNEEVYSKWIVVVKEKFKFVYNSFGYIGGMLIGYYEWGLYLVFSYCNFILWVFFKIKRDCNRRKGKVEM